MRDRRRPRLLNMADGDVLLDAMGNVLLDASGNVVLDNGLGTGNTCCCGSGSGGGVTANCCPGGGTAALQWMITLDGFTDCTGCLNWDISGSQGSINVTGGLSGSSFLLDYEGGGIAGGATSCAWTYTGPGPVSVDYYDGWGCGILTGGGTANFLETSDQIFLRLTLSSTGDAELEIWIGDNNLLIPKVALYLRTNPYLIGTGDCTGINIDGGSAFPADGPCCSSHTFTSGGITYCEGADFWLIGTATATPV